MTAPLSTKARAVLCRCGAVVLEAIAEGVPVHADAMALNRDGEVDALARGCRTYVLNRRELVLRDALRLSIPGPITADHRCGQAVAAEHRAPPSPHNRPSPRPAAPPY